MATGGKWRHAALAVAALACIGSAAMGQLADSSLGMSITAIEIYSAEPLDIAGLTALLPLRVGEPLRATDLAEARWRLRQKDIFVSFDIATVPRPDGVAVVIHAVREPIIAHIRFHGNDELSDRELRRLVRLRESTPFTAALRDYSVRRVQERYRVEGFDRAVVVAAVEPGAPGEVDVTFMITEGEPLRVVAIDFEGTPPLARDVLLHAVDIDLGERYRRDQRRDAERALLKRLRAEHSYEADVRSRWELTGDRSVRLVFAINAGPPFSIEFSGNRHFSDDHLLGLMDLPKRPLITDGTWRELARRARTAYQADGYYFAKIGIEIDPGPPKRVHFRVEEGQVFHIGDISFEGLHGLDVAQLRAAMVTGPPSWIPWRDGVLFDDVLAEDLKRLWYLYRQHGYHTAEIVDARPRFDRDAGRIFLTIVVEEGPQTLVRDVERDGFDVVPTPLTTPQLAAGEPLNPDRVDRERQALTSALAQAGYTHGEVRTDVTERHERDAVAATVRFTAVPGDRQYVGVVIVQNNFDTQAHVITRELEFKPGDPIDPNAVLQAQSNIYRLGLFRSVTVRPLEPGAPSGQPPVELAQRPPSVEAAATVPTPGGAAPAPEQARTGGVVPLLPQPRTAGEVLAGQTSVSEEALAPEPQATPNHVPIAVTVSERPPGNLFYGAGYNTRDGFRGFLEVSHDNLQGLARRISLRGEMNLQPGNWVPDEYLANLGFREPRLAETKWTLRTNLIAQRSTRKVDQFSLERIALIPALERTFRPGLQAGMELQIEEARVFDLEPDVVAFNPRDQGRLSTLSFGPFMIDDQRDDPFVPRRGRFDSVRLRLAPDNVFTDIPFFKLQLQHTQYVPLSRNLTFVYVARTAWAHTLYGNDSIVPIRERFFLGGRTTVRGFDENQIGPQGSLGNPLGGDFVVNLNTELRFPLLYGFGGVIFADGGGNYLPDVSATAAAQCSSGCALSVHEFRRSAGVGLRYITPVGPLSLEYGFKLDRRSDESIGVVHFSVGAVF